MQRTTCFPLLSALAAVALGSPAALAQPTVIALSGTAAPGSGITYSSFAVAPTLNASGQVAFSATLTGTATSGVFAGTPGSLQSMALQGTSAPGGGTYNTFNALNRPTINSLGQVVFSSTLASGTQGIYVGIPGSVQAVARVGDATPTGGTINSLVGPVLNNSGVVAFTASASPSSNSGIIAGTPGLLQTVAQVNGTAPGGGTFANFSSPGVNAAGTFAFTSATSGGPTSAIYVGTAGSLQRLAALGDAAPGGGTFHNFFSTPRLNAAGQVAFSTGSSLAGRGIYIGTPGSLQRVVAPGDAAPGGGTFSGITASTDLTLNGAGQVAFYGGTTTTLGVFVGSAGSLQSVMRLGDAAPGGGGATFSTVAGPAPNLNGAGQVAFLADVTGAGVTTANDRGLYAGAPGALVKVVREGDVVDVDPTAGTDLRTVSAIAFTFNSTGADDGRGFSFNDAGLIAYGLTFTDGSSGVFTSFVPVPEPASVLGIAAVGLGVVGGVRRLRRGRSQAPGDDKVVG